MPLQKYSNSDIFFCFISSSSGSEMLICKALLNMVQYQNVSSTTNKCGFIEDLSPKLLRTQAIKNKFSHYKPKKSLGWISA